MSLILPKNLPAINLLKKENIEVNQKTDADYGDTVRIVVLNLMPLKEATETDIARLLANVSMRVELTLMKLKSHTPTHVSAEHMDMFYKDSKELSGEHFDGMIITGAPVENFDFEDVTYWQEMTEIFEWTKTHVRSTLYICWAAQAGLYYHYGVNKIPLPMKKFGIFPQHCVVPQIPLMRGFDDVFYMPHSRHTGIKREDIKANQNLNIVVDSDESGPGVIMAQGGKMIFIVGHMEYPTYTLDQEYRRDLGKRDDVGMPQHYYLDDNPDNPPVVRWRAHANLFYNNWVNYYVRKA